MPSDTPSTVPDPRKGDPLALSAREAAKRLGIGERTLRRLVSGREVPFARIGKRVVFPVRELETWLSARAEGGNV